jgi:hypothetical protein
MLLAFTEGSWMHISSRVLVRVARLSVERIRLVVANASRLREPVA